MIPVIGLAGKIGTGKTTTAKLLAEGCGGTVVSFANELKKEAAARYNFDPAYAYSQEGKNVTILHPEFPLGCITVREILQYYGHKKRQEEPLYWETKLAAEINRVLSQNAPMVIVDDVRHISECTMLRNAFNASIFRLEPHERWVEGPHANHYSEVALDDYAGWNCVFRPKYGQLGGTVTSILLELQKGK